MSAPSTIFPSRLAPGDTIGIAAPASPPDKPEIIDEAIDRFSALGFKVKPGKFLRARDGYLAGSDEERAADINALFADPEVRGIFALRGGYGSCRILPLLDYATIRANPKPFVGYSDITAMHLAILVKAGLVTYHGSNASSAFTDGNIAVCRNMLMDNRKLLYETVHAVLLAAARKSFGPARDLTVEIDQKTGRIKVVARLLVVEKVALPHNEISLPKARQIKPDAVLRDTVEVDINTKGFGRIAAQVFKKEMNQALRGGSEILFSREDTHGANVRTVVPGRAQGQLLGGNMTCLLRLLGTPYAPDFRNVILFLEDTGEKAYRVDGMFTHLRLGGILSQIGGLVIGQFDHPDPAEQTRITACLQREAERIGVPCVSGAPIGHFPEQIVVPQGAQAELDAGEGKLQLMTPENCR